MSENPKAAIGDKVTFLARKSGNKFAGQEGIVVSIERRPMKWGEVSTAKNALWGNRAQTKKRTFNACLALVRN